VSINFGKSGLGKYSGANFDGGLVNKVNFLFELFIVESRNVANSFISCKQELQVVMAPNQKDYRS